MTETRLRVTVRLVPVDGRPAFEFAAPIPGRRVGAPRSTAASGVGTRAAKGGGASAANGTGLRGRKVLFAVVAAVTTVTACGFPYYVLPMAERLRHPFHAFLKPTGPLGQAAGLLAFSLLSFLYLYPVRKRYRALAFLGRLDRWLNVHIVAGLTVPLIAAVHAGWRFRGLIGIGYGAMLLVSLSGIVGRYLYTRIPRGRSGLELGLEAVEARRRELAVRIAEIVGRDVREIESTLETTHNPPGGGDGIFASLRRLLIADLTRWRSSRRIRRRWNRSTIDAGVLREAMRLARRQIALTQQLRMLEATHRLFRLWHVVHRPFSITAFLAVAIHVAVAVSLGVTWFW